MLDLPEIRTRLKDRRLDIISEATGLSSGTLSKIRDGVQTNPKRETMNALSVYFANQEGRNA